MGCALMKNFLFDVVGCFALFSGVLSGAATSGNCEGGLGGAYVTTADLQGRPHWFCLSRSVFFNQVLRLSR